MSTPEPDEISGGSSSTQDVYSDVMGGLMMGSQLVQQQPHQEVPIGSALSSSAVLAELLPGHSRNSSGTSHSGGSASGYGSLASQSQHSRQSSSGELGHFRSVFLFYDHVCLSTFPLVVVLTGWPLPLPTWLVVVVVELLLSVFLPSVVVVVVLLVVWALNVFLFFCLHNFLVSPLPFFVHLSDAACVDFRPGLSGRHASPSFVCLSAEA